MGINLEFYSIGGQFDRINTTDQTIGSFKESISFIDVWTVLLILSINRKL